MNSCGELAWNDPALFLTLKLLMCAEIWKKLSILWYPKFQLVTVKYHEVEALFCKMSRHFEKYCLCSLKMPIPGHSFGYRSCIQLEIWPHFTALYIAVTSLFLTLESWLTPHFKGILNYGLSNYGTVFIPLAAQGVYHLEVILGGRLLNLNFLILFLKMSHFWEKKSMENNLETLS